MSRTDKQGFSLIETLLAATLFSVAVGAIVGAIIYGRESLAIAGQRARAIMLAEEGVEAIRNIRDETPTNAFANITDGTYGLMLSGNSWTLSGSSDTTDSFFERQLAVSSVDADTKQIVSTVTWDETLQRAASVSVTAQLTDWQTPPPVVMGDWSLPLLGFAVDLTNNNSGYKVQIQGEYAYLVKVNATPDFFVIDITDTAAAAQAGSLNVASVAYDLAVSGNYAYVASSDNSVEMAMVDITNPAAPSAAASFNAAGNQNANGVFVSGGYAYLVRDNAGTTDMHIINIANPLAPVQTGTASLGAGNYKDVVVSGNYAFVGGTDNAAEVIVVDITNPAAPVTAATIDLGGTADVNSVAIYANTLFIARADSNLYLYDVTAPAAPSPLGTYGAGGIVYDVSVAGSLNLAFISTGADAQELQIIDFTDTGSPALHGSYDLTGISDSTGIAYDSGKDAAAITHGNPDEFNIVIPTPP